MRNCFHGAPLIQVKIICRMAILISHPQRGIDHPGVKGHFPKISAQNKKPLQRFFDYLEFKVCLCIPVGIEWI